MNIEFGIMAKDLKDQLCEFDIPSEQITSWQSIADFIITAHISHAIGDKQFEKLNNLLGSMIATYLKERESK